ncbi:MAG: type II secretion system F family protein [Phycisphaerae bacterium]
MATFQYIAKTTGGEEVSGAIQADNEAAVVRSLRERSLFPVQVQEQSAKASALRGGRVRVRHLATLYGQLADLLRAGVPLVRALETLSRATTNPTLKRAVGNVREAVSEGETLADAMAQHPEVFRTLHVAMVRAGERAGFLEDVFANLGEFLERQDDLQSKVRGALIYPAVLVVVGLLVMVIVLLWMVPKFEGVFEGMSLPLATEILFAVSTAMREYSLLLLGGIAAGIAALVAGIRSETGRQMWDRGKLKVPVLGGVLRSLCITRFCRILGTMLRNGVPILQAMNISRDAAGNVVLAETIDKAAESVRAGEPLADPLRDSGLFPPEILEMIAVAEESNQLEKVLVEIADTVERRTNRAVDTAVHLVEPLILVLLAGAIGFAAFGLLYPIFTIARTLN